MKKVKIVLVVALFLVGFVIARPMAVKAADVSGAMMNMENMPMGQDQMKTDMKKPEVAIDGHCPVALMQGMAVKGSDDFWTEYKGKIYKFGNEENKKMFLADPEKYTKDLDAKYAEWEAKEKMEKK